MKDKIPRWDVELTPFSPANGVPETLHFDKSTKVIVYAQTPELARETAQSYAPHMRVGAIRRVGEYQREGNMVVTNEPLKLVQGARSGR